MNIIAVSVAVVFVVLAAIVVPSSTVAIAVVVN